MTYQHVKCENFVRKANGIIQSVQCKLCGVTIADTVERTVRYERTRGGQTLKVVERKLVRFSNYREIKIAFENPNYFHVTHGCANCLSLNMPPAKLAEMHAVDQAESPDGFTAREAAQVPTHVVVLQEDQSGIV